MAERYFRHNTFSLYKQKLYLHVEKERFAIQSKQTYIKTYKVRQIKNIMYTSKS